MKKLVPVFSAFLLAAVMSSVAMAQPDSYTTKSGYMAAPTEVLLDKLIVLAGQKDYAAIDKMVDAGQAIFLKGGMKVVVMKRTFGTVKIRKVGSLAEVWTVREAIF